MNKLFFFAVPLVALMLSPLPAMATPTPTVISVTGPLTKAQFQALNGTGAEYGPPANATFPDGPYTVSSGDDVSLTGGPAADNADSLVLVLSARASDLDALTGTITLTFTDADNVQHSVIFGSNDFFSTADAGFPESIDGIANGAVNGIKFPDSEHAGADILFDSTLPKDEVIGSVAISSSIDLRVDVFGDNGGLIVGNASNSGAEGVTPVSVPEPEGLGLLGLGLMALGAVTARRSRTRGRRADKHSRGR